MITTQRMSSVLFPTSMGSCRPKRWAWSNQRRAGQSTEAGHHVGSAPPQRGTRRQGSRHHLIERAASAKVRFFVSDYILDELADVLREELEENVEIIDVKTFAEYLPQSP